MGSVFLALDFQVARTDSRRVMARLWRGVTSSLLAAKPVRGMAESTSWA